MADSAVKPSLETNLDSSLSARRLISLDVMRGMTVAGMLLVNNPGSWSPQNIYPPLQHAAWNGWTFTDLIFPFFLFMVGVSMMFSFPRRLAQGASRWHLFGHVVRRALVLVMLGFWGATFPFWPSGGAVFAEASSSAVSNLTDASGLPTFGQGFFRDLGLLGAGGIALRIGYALTFLGAVVLISGTKRPRVWGSVLGFGGALALVGALTAGLSMTLEDGTKLTAPDPMGERLAGARWPGVLVRIGICYLVASGLYLLTPSRRAIVRWIMALLAIYAVWMLYVPIPGYGQPDLSVAFPNAETPTDQLFSNWCFYLDYHLLGEHTWSSRTLRDASGALIWSFDPEGILSTLSAVATVLLGVLAGLGLQRSDRSAMEKTNALMIGGCVLSLIGLVMSIEMPINKRLWTSSFTVFTAGMASLCLGLCYHAIDVKGYRRWALPFQWFGMNAITAFFFSGMMAVMLGRLKVSSIAADGSTQLISWKGWIFARLGEHLTPIHASLAYAVLFVLVWTIIVGVMHRRRWFVKI